MGFDDAKNSKQKTAKSSALVKSKPKKKRAVTKKSNSAIVPLQVNIPKDVLRDFKMQCLKEDLQGRDLFIKMYRFYLSHGDKISESYEEEQHELHLD